MLEYIVAISLHNRPIKLLPPLSRNNKPVVVCLAHGGDGGRRKKIALQVPMGTQLVDLLSHN